MNEIKLLPCPFCGGENIKVWGDKTRDYWCQCMKCLASTESEDKKEEAVKAWNTRKPIEKNNNGWIPCSERLPERIGNTFGNGNKRQNVLVTLKNGIVKEMLYEFCTKEFWEAGDENPIAHWKEDATDTDLDVIAWQPLPEPYKESEEQ